MPLNKSSELKRRRLSNANRQSDDFVSIGESSAIDSATQEVEFTIECEIELSSKYSTDGVDSVTQEAESVIEYESDLSADVSANCVYIATQEVEPIVEYEPDLPSENPTDGEETQSDIISGKFKYR